MLRSEGENKTGASENRCKLSSSVVAIHRGWRPQDHIEREALDALLKFGPLGQAFGEAVYVGFPWSALFDSFKNPELLEAPLLRSTLTSLPARFQRGTAAVTVCSHPDLPKHITVMENAGITDVFWTEAQSGVETLPNAPRILIHPFPKLPPIDREVVSGTGPKEAYVICEEPGNTERLWSALAAGKIPVLSMSSARLPGNAAIWQFAALFHNGSEEDISRIPEWMEKVAADPQRLEAARLAGAGLQLIYGRGRMVHDVLIRLMESTEPSARKAGQSKTTQSLTAALIDRFSGRDQLSKTEAQLVLHQAGCDLLAGEGRGVTMAPGQGSVAIWRLIGLARKALDDESITLARFDEIIDLLRSRDLLPTRNDAGTRARQRTSPIKIFLFGPRGQRTPLSYEPLRRHVKQRIEIVDHPEKADVLVTGWNRDFEDHKEYLTRLWRNGKRPKLAVLSEEPLWDSLWSGDLAPRDRLLDCGKGMNLPYRSLNHVNSSIFQFDTLPWFILSDDRYTARYAQLISDFASSQPKQLLERWKKAEWQAAFVAERRTTEEYAATYPVEGVVGLSIYRSRVAELAVGEDIVRIGQGWAGTETRRQQLPDWHLDKLARLHGNVRVCAAYENTLQKQYITEKPFDAFAVGAVPAVVADDEHRLVDLILPEAMINTRYCTPDVAAARISSFVPDSIMAEAWIETAQSLLERFRSHRLILAERQRIADECYSELSDLLQGSSATAAA
ncbi:hypothetical protein ACSBLW_14415 [Thioclava sp. FR2]|uniref:hypothetical protein n=1 Tax=Thioclava sp. FR2 TaxID=3445780 RepID=UPI003EBE5D7D